MTSRFSDRSPTQGPSSARKLSDRVASFPASAISNPAEGLQILDATARLNDAQLYKSLVKGVTNQAIFLVDLEGNILSWNTGVQQIFGYPESDFVGKNLDFLFNDADSSHGVLQNAVEDAIQHGSTLETGWHIRVNRSRVHFSCLLTVVAGEPGCASGLAIVMQEAALQKQGEGKFERRTQLLRQSNEDLSQLGEILSHDLRAPLCMVGSYIGVLAKDLDGKLDETSRECMSSVLLGVEYMDRLITSLVSYARAEDTPAASRVDLGLVLQKATIILKTLLIENDAVVTQDPLPIVQGDPTLLLQLFQNLITNALKYRSTSPPQIHIAARETSTDWILSIRDNGIGIDSRDAEEIFLPFTRLHDTQAAGSGMGLAICKRIIERHRGNIWVESAIGSGSTFTFSLPKGSSADLQI